VEAAVLGWSLKQVGAQHPYVLLHTGDVPSRYLRILKDDVGWELKMVNKITDGDVLCKNLRFMGVFTKFHALSLTEYDKIVMLDVDLLVRRNVDHLFERHAPTATRRGSPGNHEDDAPIPDQCGINAGVMILRPSNNVFKRILADLKEKKKKGQVEVGPTGAEVLYARAGLPVEVVRGRLAAPGNRLQFPDSPAGLHRPLRRGDV